MTAGRSYRLPKRMRLKSARQFKAVYRHGLRKRVGPVTIFARPNDREHLRLGLSVPRRVGKAAVRNRIKRLLREAFRLMQHDWPRGYDVVVNVYPHEPLMLADYQKLLFKALRALHHRWQTEKTNQTAPSNQATNENNPAGPGSSRGR